MTNEYGIEPDLAGAAREFTHSVDGCVNEKGNEHDPCTRS
jgi:hypothetical protein